MKTTKNKNNRKKDGNLNLFDFALGLSVGDDNKNSHELEQRILMLTGEIKKRDEIIDQLKKKNFVSDEILKRIEELKNNSDNVSTIITNLATILNLKKSVK